MRRIALRRPRDISGEAPRFERTFKIDVDIILNRLFIPALVPADRFDIFSRGAIAISSAGAPAAPILYKAPIGRSMSLRAGVAFRKIRFAFRTLKSIFGNAERRKTALAASSIAETLFRFFVIP